MDSASAGTTTQSDGRGSRATGHSGLTTDQISYLRPASSNADIVTSGDSDSQDDNETLETLRYSNVYESVGNGRQVVYNKIYKPQNVNDAKTIAIIFKKAYRASNSDAAIKQQVVVVLREAADALEKDKILKLKASVATNDYNTMEELLQKAKRAVQLSTAASSKTASSLNQIRDQQDKIAFYEQQLKKAEEKKNEIVRQADEALEERRVKMKAAYITIERAYLINTKKKDWSAAAAAVRREEALPEPTNLKGLSKLKNRVVDEYVKRIVKERWERKNFDPMEFIGMNTAGNYNLAVSNLQQSMRSVSTLRDKEKEGSGNVATDLEHYNPHYVPREPQPDLEGPKWTISFRRARRKRMPKASDQFPGQSLEQFRRVDSPSWEALGFTSEERGRRTLSK